MARLPSYVNNEIWLAKSFLLRHAIACNVAGGRHTLQLLHKMLQKQNSLQLAWQLQRLAQGAIQPLRTMLYHVARPYGKHFGARVCVCVCVCVRACVRACVSLLSRERCRALSYKLAWSNRPGQTNSQVSKTRTCVRTCDGWPNGFPSQLASSRKSQKAVTHTVDWQSRLCRLAYKFYLHQSQRKSTHVGG